MDASGALNSLLLPGPTLGTMRRVVSPEGAQVWTHDLSYVPFLIEELVRHSAPHIAVNQHSPFYEARDSLPRALRDRIVDVDGDRAAEKAYAVLASALRELGVERSGPMFRLLGDAHSQP